MVFLLREITRLTCIHTHTHTLYSKTTFKSLESVIATVLFLRLHLKTSAIFGKYGARARGVLCNVMYVCVYACLCNMMYVCISVFVYVIWFARMIWCAWGERERMEFWVFDLFFVFSLYYFQFVYRCLFSFIRILLLKDVLLQFFLPLRIIFPVNI